MLLENLEICAVFLKNNTSPKVCLTICCTRGMTFPEKFPACSFHLLFDQALNLKLLIEHTDNKVSVNTDLNLNIWLLFSELYCIIEIRFQHQSFSYQCILVSSTVLGITEELNTYFLIHGEMDRWMKAHNSQWAEEGIAPFLLLPLPPSPKNFTDGKNVLSDIGPLVRPTRFTFQGLKLPPPQWRNVPPLLVTVLPSSQGHTSQTGDLKRTGQPKSKAEV